MKVLRIVLICAVCFAAAPLFAGGQPADNMEIARYYQLENKIQAVAEFDMAVAIPVIPVTAPGK